MKAEIVVIGMGQLGRVFAEAFLVMGHPVIPVLRGMDLSGLAARHPAPRLVLVATGEDDLAPVLDTLPASWRSRLALLQNELLPMHWMAHGVETPTVVPVWFEKKAGKPTTPLMPSPVFGPAAPLVAAALERVGIPARLLEDEEALLYALVLKNLYILITNIAGLKVGGVTGTLRERHWDLVEGLGGEILAIQEGLTGAMEIFAGRGALRERRTCGI